MDRFTLGLLFLSVITMIYGVNSRLPSTETSTVQTSSQLRDSVIQKALQTGETEFSFVTDQPPPPMQSGAN